MLVQCHGSVIIHALDIFFLFDLLKVCRTESPARIHAVNRAMPVLLRVSIRCHQRLVLCRYVHHLVLLLGLEEGGALSINLGQIDSPHSLDFTVFIHLVNRLEQTNSLIDVFALLLKLLLVFLSGFNLFLLYLLLRLYKPIILEGNRREHDDGQCGVHEDDDDVELPERAGLDRLFDPPDRIVPFLALEAKLLQPIGRVLHPVHAEDGDEEDEQLEEGNDRVANVVRPDLDRQELPVLHLVQVLPLLLCQLHVRLVVLQRRVCVSQLHVNDRDTLVLLVLLSALALHLGEVLLGGAAAIGLLTCRQVRELVIGNRRLGSAIAMRYL